MRRYIVASLLIVVGAPAWGHRPTSFDADEIITDSTISWTIPGDFTTGEEVFSFTLEYESPFAAPFEVLVPTEGDNGTFRPQYAIIGPGLPEPSAATLEALPADATVEPGSGVFFEANDDENRFLFFEGVMRRALVSSGSTAVALGAGTFTVWIWSPDQRAGEFMFGFGVEENFEDGGFGGVFSNWGDFAY